MGYSYELYPSWQRHYMYLPYLAYFNLKEEPFSTVPSPRYFFLTATHSTALEKTAYVVGAKKGLTAVFGDTGTGKSSLARLLHQKFLDSGFLSTLLTNPNYPTPYSFLRTITQEFDTQRTDKSFKGTLDIFKTYLLIQALEQGKTVLPKRNCGRPWPGPSCATSVVALPWLPL